MSEVAPLLPHMPRVVIAVVTYRRPADLRRLIPALIQQACSATHEGLADGVEVLVVDNDPDRSAKPVVDAANGQISYVAEPAPGVAAARNRALRSSPESDLLVFIDDDETPAHRDWLVQLLRARSRFAANVVAGPVKTVFEGQPDGWIIAGRFFARDHRAGLPTGAPITRAATNNLLLDLKLVRKMGLIFDDAFGRSGGEDSLFTSRLSRAGAVMVWCAEAGVLDHLPPARRSRAHALRRTRSMAAAGVRVDVALSDSKHERVRVRARAVAAGGARLVLGLLRVGVSLPSRSTSFNAVGHRDVSRGVGAISGAFGRVYVDYGSADADAPKGPESTENIRGSHHG